MATESVLLQHPAFPKVVNEAPSAEAAKPWIDAGWKRVKKEDEAKIRAEADQPTVA